MCLYLIPVIQRFHFYTSMNGVTFFLKITSIFLFGLVFSHLLYWKKLCSRMAIDGRCLEHTHIYKDFSQIFCSLSLQYYPQLLTGLISDFKGF